MTKKNNQTPSTESIQLFRKNPSYGLSAHLLRENIFTHNPDKKQLKHDTSGGIGNEDTYQLAYAINNAALNRPRSAVHILTEKFSAPTTFF